MKAESRQLREAEKLINTLMDGIPAALETLQDLQGVSLPSEVKLSSPLKRTAAKLLRNVQAYEVWASKRATWASR